MKRDDVPAGKHQYSEPTEPLTERQETLIDRYADGWEELNVIDSLIRELEKRREEIKARQRQNANSLIHLQMERQGRRRAER